MDSWRRGREGRKASTEISSRAARQNLMLENGANIPMIQVPEPASAHDSTTMSLDRITTNPKVMGGKPCIRGMRVTAGTVVGLVATEHTREEILELYPY